MLRTLLLALAASATLAAPAFAQGACPPAGYNAQSLADLKAREFVIESDLERNTLARAMTACLASPDPTLRDGIAFEALAHWMRRRELTEATLTALADDLLARMQSTQPEGFEAPFAALVMAEVVRADRLNPFLDETRRARILDAAVTYVTNVRDYRGFDPHEGWRHGVAHGADLLLQIAFHEGYDRAALLRVRDAVASQIAPENHFYIYGEPERLARPILVIARRGLISEEEWTPWFAGVTGPGALGAWGNAFTSNEGLSRKHNVSEFVRAIYVNAKFSGGSDFDALLPGAEATIRAIP